MVPARICGAGCQRDAPAKGFAKRSISAAAPLRIESNTISPQNTTLTECYREYYNSGDHGASRAPHYSYNTTSKPYINSQLVLPVERTRSIAYLVFAATQPSKDTSIIALERFPSPNRPTILQSQRNLHSYLDIARQEKNPKKKVLP